MRPCCSVFGHALDAMAAALVAQVRIDVVAADAEDDFLEAALLAGAEGDVLDLPAHVAGVVGVHVVEVAGEQGGLVAAGAGPDFHDDAAEVLARLDQQQVFEPRLQGLARARAAPFSSSSAYWRISGSLSAAAMTASALAMSSSSFLYSR